MVKRILFLMSDTGGGHRAAAEAIRDALFIRYGKHNLLVDLVDVFKESFFPLNYMPEFYPVWINNSKASWGIGYNLSNTRRRAKVLSRGMYLTSGHLLRRMVREYPADVIVSVHSVITRPTLYALHTLQKRPPFVTVVTDLVSTHMFWYDARVERCLVPTQAAYDRGLESGISPAQMRITGLPVHPQFMSELKDRDKARYELGWEQNIPTILMVGGGQGMGPLFDTARAINQQRLNCQLAIIAGRNAPLKARLEAAQWNQPTHIYGFVRDMPRLMSAGDMIVTKAGPGTICEAAIAELPMIISDAIPGQETGNIDYVVNNNAGVYAPTPDKVAATVTAWLQEGEAGLRRRAENAKKIGHPNAVWEIAEEVWEQAHKPPITIQRRTFLHDLLEAPAEIFPTIN